MENINNDQPAPLSGSIEEQAKDYLHSVIASYYSEKDIKDAFIAGHNSQPSVQVLVDALDKILHMKREPGEHVDKWAFNRCWHLANNALQQFNTGEEKQEQEGQQQIFIEVIKKVRKALKEIASIYDLSTGLAEQYTITKKK